MDRPNRDDLVQLILRRERQLIILAFLSGLGLSWAGFHAIGNLEFPSAIDWMLIVPTLSMMGAAAFRLSRFVRVAEKAGLSVLVPWGEGFKSLCAILASSAGAGMGAFVLVVLGEVVATTWSLWRGLPQPDPLSVRTVVLVVFKVLWYVLLLVYMLISMRRARKKFVSCVRAAAGICVRCGYSLAGIDSARCPECGTSRPTPEPTVDKAS